jgi:hypothetical protein
VPEGKAPAPGAGRRPDTDSLNPEDGAPQPTAFDRLTREAAARLAGFATRRTRSVGGGGGSGFETAPERNGVLIGFQAIKGFAERSMRTRSFMPVFLSDRGQEEAGMLGNPAGPSLPPVLARPGYAVGALDVAAGKGPDDYSGTEVCGIRLIFMRLRPDLTLDVRDAYASGWIGDDTGEVTRLGGDGAPIVGLHGRSAYRIDALGLIQAGGPSDEAR